MCVVRAARDTVEIQQIFPLWQYSVEQFSQHVFHTNNNKYTYARIHSQTPHVAANVNLNKLSKDVHEHD